MGKVIVLVVSIVMPANMPDIQHVQRMESFDACWTGAKAYMEHDLSDEMRARGAVGLSAACGFQELPSQRN